jgi:hypothetical protein
MEAGTRCAEVEVDPQLSLRAAAALWLCDGRIGVAARLEAAG